MDTIEIQSIPHFLDFVLHNDSGLWYRGESSDFGESRLTPSIFRGSGYLEQNMFFEFQGTHHENFKNYNKFQWLCLMQHHNLPTRLLDWTTNPLVALYFASHGINSDGFIYSVSPEKLNGHFGEEYLFTSEHMYAKSRVEMIFHQNPTQTIHCECFTHLHPDSKSGLAAHLAKYCNSPIAIQAEITNPRMIAQSSKFTLHGGNNTYKFSPEKITSCTDVKTYRIDKCLKQNILTQLETISIHEGTLFPDFEHTANFLSRKYKISTDNIQPTN